MAARKLQQEIDKCFKQVDIGVEGFDAQYEKYEQSTNASQREKQVDTLKKECKKLQRLRDQIKTWAAGNDVKDKGPLQDKRELIESKMEAFKAVEKEMKTKAFSKEGLLVTSKMDPKERERDEMREFLSQMVDELGLQIEAAEVEMEQIQVQTKKKKDAGKVERLTELEHRTERLKYHQGCQEQLMRRLANDALDVDSLKEIQDSIRYYVENNQEVDFYEDEGLYDEFSLDDDPEPFGVSADHNSSQESQSVQEEASDTAQPSDPGKGRTKAEPVNQARRPSIPIKSPLPALATLHNLPVPAAATVSTNLGNMKPAPPPAKPLGETLKYASAAAAGAASDTAGIGISPLPPPVPKASMPVPTAEAAAALSIEQNPPPAPSASAARSATPAAQERKAPVPQQIPPTARSPVSSASGRSPAVTAAQVAQIATRDQPTPSASSNGQRSRELSRQASLRESTQSSQSQSQPQAQNHDRSGSQMSVEASTNTAAAAADLSRTNGVQPVKEQEEESVFHLPASLQELVDCYEDIKKSAAPPSAPEHLRMLDGSYLKRPDTLDAERPRFYKPTQPAAYTPQHYPQEPHVIFDNPELYARMDPDALFYAFYYRQGTFQQYLAARELKSNSWRFHKQYQTWFQRHEEPLDITEDFERGTYRFFDYESTWLNRRKGDFEFRYRYLEDEV